VVRTGVLSFWKGATGPLEGSHDHINELSGSIKC
jgi:hypothetical protein